MLVAVVSAAGVLALWLLLVVLDSELTTTTRGAWS